MSTIYRALFGPKNNSPIIVKILFAFSCLDNHEQAVNIKNIQEHKNMLHTSIESSPQGEATLHGTLLDWNCGLKFEPSVDQISQLSYQVQRLSKVLIKGFQQIHLWSAKKIRGQESNLALWHSYFRNSPKMHMKMCCHRKHQFHASGPFSKNKKKTDQDTMEWYGELIGTHTQKLQAKNRLKAKHWGLWGGPGAFGAQSPPRSLISVY